VLGPMALRASHEARLRAAGRTFTHDGNGNLTSDGQEGVRLCWSGWGRITG